MNYQLLNIQYLACVKPVKIQRLESK